MVGDQGLWCTDEIALKKKFLAKGMRESDQYVAASNLRRSPYS